MEPFEKAVSSKIDSKKVLLQLCLKGIQAMIGEDAYVTENDLKSMILDSDQRSEVLDSIRVNLGLQPGDSINPEAFVTELLCMAEVKAQTSVPTIFQGEEEAE